PSDDRPVYQPWVQMEGAGTLGGSRVCRGPWASSRRRRGSAWTARPFGSGETGPGKRALRASSLVTPKRRRRRIPVEVVELIAHAGREFGWGACRTRLWLMRVHQVKVAAKTITRIGDDLGLPRPQRGSRRRPPRQLKLFEKAKPGESVQIDVKVVRVGGTKAYQYTALDDCTRLQVLRLYRRLNTFSSLDFLAQVLRALPFPIRKIQTDHGTEFSFGFILAIERAGIRHRYIQPRRPEQN